MRRYAIPGAFGIAARAAGIAWSIAFIVVGLAAGLQLYADGSIFSYAIADRATWAIHWHNIAQRLTTHVLTHVPAEAYVALTGDGPGGIAIYGALFFGAPLAGLLLTRALDRTPERVHSAFACASTALLAPLVFGFPTELWLSMALLWPVMASLHGPMRWPWPVPLVLLMALAFTHEGGLLLAVVAVSTLALRGWRDGEFRRGLVLLGVAMASWLSVKLLARPDDYFASAYTRSAVGFLGLGVLNSPIMLLLYGSVGGFAASVLVLARFHSHRPQLIAGAVTVLGVAAVWLVGDVPVHAAERYPVRTIMLGGAVLMVIAAAVLSSDLAARPPKELERLATPALGALFLVMLVHAVETARFVHAWGAYKEAVRTLAMGDASDPGLGDARFVNSERIGERLNRLSWYSTTQYLSVLLAPGWVPKRLVVDPDAGYYWLSCAEAKADEVKPSAIPRESRKLIRILSCKHR